MSGLRGLPFHARYSRSRSHFDDPALAAAKLFGCTLQAIHQLIRHSYACHSHRIHPCVIQCITATCILIVIRRFQRCQPLFLSGSRFAKAFNARLTVIGEDDFLARQVGDDGLTWCELACQYLLSQWVFDQLGDCTFQGACAVYWVEAGCR